MARRRLVAVIGEGVLSDPVHAELAEAVGRGIARAGHVLVCGGLGGVMEAAARGATEAGGIVVGLLPGRDPAEANGHVTIPIATGLGQARNAVIATACDAAVAIGRGFGTLSEIGHVLRQGKPVIGLRTWSAEAAGEAAPVVRVETADDALAALDAALDRGARG